MERESRVRVEGKPDLQLEILLLEEEMIQVRAQVGEEQARHGKEMASLHDKLQLLRAKRETVEAAAKFYPEWFYRVD